MPKLKRIMTESDTHQWDLNDTYTELRVNEQVYFEIPSNYPFKPPILMIDNVPYTRIVTERYKSLLPLIEKNKYPIPCPCCFPIIYDWSPCYTCMDVYMDYMKYTQKLNYVVKLNKIPFDDLILKNISVFLF